MFCNYAQHVAMHEVVLVVHGVLNMCSCVAMQYNRKKKKKHRMKPEAAFVGLSVKLSPPEVRDK